jgi:valyl-tRNA synthetase
VCDWYLELVKGRLGDGADAASREAARSTLVAVLDRSFRLLHPVVPFVTAELWSRLPWPEGEARPEDLIIAPWPDGADGFEDADAERGMRDVQSLVVEVRRLRKEYGISEGERIVVHVTGASPALTNALEAMGTALERLARIGRVEMVAGAGVGAHAVLESGFEVFVPLEGVIDIAREAGRLREEIGRLEGQLKGTQARLANEKFTGNAPADVVQKERDKAQQLEEQGGKLREKLAGLEAGLS